MPKSPTLNLHEILASHARSFIREVAAWLDLQGQHGCSPLLREEAGR
jgi:hypothetical protein